eukprot:CAMPEP_0113569194 /NCGR_PEP_ID=MMETSP0015_2-20120614/24270_1 /TAXON_ID=2838 /ORGANISM="Odontella" /LENGTH=101 /DNA_ID=CAMNT_0000471821 /DNA_START=62 /DNA_END=368 /DNA_ORIENTATION=- /assembly_acc=CAM_ASM_000160
MQAMQNLAGIYIGKVPCWVEVPRGELLLGSESAKDQSSRAGAEVFVIVAGRAIVTPLQSSRELKQKLVRPPLLSPRSLSWTVGGKWLAVLRAAALRRCGRI